MAASTGGAYYTRQGKPVIKQKPPAEAKASDFAEAKRKEDAERTKPAATAADKPAPKAAAEQEK